MLTPTAIVFVVTVAALLAGAMLLHATLRLTRRDGRIHRGVARAPGADAIVFFFTAAPQVAGPIVAGWGGLGAAVAGQIVALGVWIAGHEIVHRGRTRGRPRIHTTLRGLVGGWRNHFAVWWTALAVPVFWLIRLAEIFV
ncbi:MAG: hypothetical protein KJO43_06225, partial [Phycisphaerae bacterium]|nr:hypothetical protein [Phycisphaerae bacterium]